MHFLANPARFSRLSKKLLPLLAAGCAAALGYGLYLALWASPEDYQQGMTVRIMYVHVPAAWLSLMIYAGMAVASASYLIWKHPLADIIAQESAPIGATLTFITLVTGSLWGKPMWGAWWVWDARLTSVLILFFLYIGYIMLLQSGQPGERSSRAVAILALVGAINLPIIKFSVDWWNTLHQPASVFRMDGPSIDSSMLTPLLVMALGFVLLYLCLLLLRVQAALIRQKIRRLQWQQM